MTLLKDSPYPPEVWLTQRLIQCPSVTPDEGGSIALLEEWLEDLGFTCHTIVFEDTTNLYARRGETGPNLCFAGHVDVVPEGDIKKWSVPPFDGHIQGDVLIGRGAVDMKGAIGAYIAALSEISSVSGSLSLLITSDEEGDATNGTVKMLDWLRRQGEEIHACLVGEPTNPTIVGEMVKVGRRGSLNGKLTLHGKAGHVAYPQQAQNPVPVMARLLSELCAYEWDRGIDYFDPSHLEVTSVDVGNPTRNVIPGSMTALFNIRFNTCHSEGSLTQRLHQLIQGYPLPYDLVLKCSAEPFMSHNHHLGECLSEAIEKATGQRPIFSTSGGTSDARFIKNFCPVIECGLVNQRAHQVNEYVSFKDLKILKSIYKFFIDKYFS